MIKGPPAILYISSRGDVGAGGENYLLTVMRHLDRLRFSPTVVLPWEGTLRKPLEELDVDVEVVPAESGWLERPEPWYRLMAGLRGQVHQLADILSKKNVRLVHTNSNHRLEGALAARLCGVHHLYLAHIEFQSNMPFFVRLPIANASYAQLMGEMSSKIVAVSRSVADTLSPPLPTDSIQVIHNGLEMEQFDNTVAAADGSLRVELGLPGDALLVTAVGRLNIDKGFDFFLDAAVQVLSGKPEVHFLLVGGDEDTAFAGELRRRAKSAGIERNFHFLGFRSDIPRVLAETDIFVLSSRREGHPYVLLEAMACGCAPVAMRCAGVMETVVEGESGLTVEVGDVAGMVDCVRRFIQSPALRKGMAEAARNRIREHFQAESGIRQLMDVYDEVLSAPAPVAGSYPVDFFLQAAGEIGALGLKNVELEERLRQVEQFVKTVKDNPASRAAYRFVQLFGGRS